MAQKYAVLGMAAAAAFSNASFSAPIPTCPASARLTTYLSGGTNATCTVLDKTITGVSLSTIDFVASSVVVHPVTVAHNPGLNFSLSLTAVPNGAATIAFTITAPSSDPMTDASLAVRGELFSSGGSFGDVETLSNGAILTATNLQLTANTTFAAAATSLNVTNALSVANASLTSFTNQFSETPVVPVPKPSPLASLALLGLAAPQSTPTAAFT